FFVADEVLESEPIVCGNEVDARGRSAPARLEKIARTGEPVGELRGKLVTVPKPTNRITIATVPLGPSNWEVSNLISALANIPWLRDQLCGRQHRVLVNDVEKPASPIVAIRFARESGGEIESEAVDVHLRYPISEAIQDDLENLGMPRIDGVPAPCEVTVL